MAREELSESDATERIAAILDDDGYEPPPNSQKDDTETPKDEGTRLELVRDSEPEPDPEPEPEPEPEPDPEPEPEPEPEPDEFISTIAGVAEAFDVEPDEFLEAIEIENAEGEPVALKQVVDVWRSGIQDAERIQADADERVSVIEKEALAKSDAELKKLAGMTQAMINHFTGKFRDINWEQLRAEAPEEWAQARHEQEQTERFIQEALASIDAVSKERAQAHEGELEKFRAEQGKALVKAMPAWADKDVRKKALDQGADWLEKNGFSREEINGIEDHRHAITAWKASEYDRIKSEGKKKISEAEKKRLKRPRALKGQARRDPDDPRIRKRNEAVLRLKETGDARAAASLIEEHLD